MAWVFGVSLFLSAALLFVIQPLMGAVALPKFGGGPAVWNSCMVFYQAMLLAGYAYAHFAPQRLGLEWHRRLHLVLLFLPLLVVPLGWLIWPFATAPLGLAEAWAPPASDFPAPFVVMVLLATIGAPFFVLATSAPLLQKWYATTGQSGSQDPYFLYAASNLGSLIALLGYPFVIERYLSLPTQGWLWLVGYVAFAGLLAACIQLASGGRQSPVVPEAAEAADPPPWADALASPNRAERFFWVARAFVPSSLMLGMTTHFTTEIAPVPLLWVVPLAVYLVSFIIAFSRLPVPVLRSFTFLMPGAVLLLSFLLLSGTKLPMEWAFAVHLAVLFIVATALHGAIAESRPAPTHLTEFFLWIALGGVLGGSFNAWVAPLVFPGLAEYPIALILAALLLPPLVKEETHNWQWIPDLLLFQVIGLMGVVLMLRLTGHSLVGWLRLHALTVAAGVVLYLLIGLAAVILVKADRFRSAFDWLMPLAIAVFALVLHMTTDLRPVCISIAGLLVALTATAVLFARRGRWWHLMYVAWPLALCNVFYLLMFQGRLSSSDDNLLHYALPLVLSVAALDRPLRFGLGVAAVFLVNLLVTGIAADNVLFRERSFFGVCKVIQEDVHTFRAHKLVHGSILHGYQPLDPQLKGLPCSYYHANGPLGELMTELQRRQQRLPIAVIGLGTGTMASWGQPGQEVAFFEIDPAIVRIAQDPGLFTYWTDADKRGVKLRVAPGDGRVKLGQEADGYFGVIVVDAFSSDAIPAHLLTREAVRTYISKLAVGGVVAVHISNRYLDLEPVLGNLAADAGLAAYRRFDDDESGGLKEASDWVMLARQPENLAGIIEQPGWKKLEARPEHRLWTDDYRNLLDVYHWKTGLSHAPSS